LYRWGGTPLQAAVNFGHVEVANMLKGKGGAMPESVGATQLCDAAAKGDVQTLRLLVECAGIQVNKACFAVSGTQKAFNHKVLIYFNCRID
jgi:hypothetical protein